MSRLIDADEFEKFIKAKYKDGESTDDIKDQMLFDLSYQPTTYDVEKVVAELEEEVKYQDKKSDEAGTFEKVSISNARISMRKCYEHAIDIVRKGGISE